MEDGGGENVGREDDCHTSVVGDDPEMLLTGGLTPPDLSLTPSSSSRSSSTSSSTNGGHRTSPNSLNGGPGGGPPMTSTHVQQLSSLCPPFPEAHLTSLSGVKDDDSKSKFYFFSLIQIALWNLRLSSVTTKTASIKISYE